ncbi:MAG: HAD family hydrolase [Candidatus Diapherotrites archaeon]|nr:HAD family hydrolase [Candidatus Diapherotrites archaeon]
MIRAVFFDLDGVLTPHKTGGFTTCKYISEKLKLDFDKVTACYKSLNKKLNTGKERFDGFVEKFCKCLGQELDIKVFDDAFESTPLNYAVFEIAKKLKKNYKIGIITENNTKRIRIVSKKFGLDSLFDTILVSEEIGVEKESQELFEFALNALGIKAEESIFIDNQEKNLVIPKQMGFRTIFFDDEKNDSKALVLELQKSGVKI